MLMSHDTMKSVTHTWTIIKDKKAKAGGLSVPAPAASPAPGSRNPMVGAAILKVSEECLEETALPAPSPPRISGYPSTAALCTSQTNPCLALKTNQGVRETARARRPAAPAPVHFSRPHTPAA